MGGSTPILGPDVTCNLPYETSNLWYVMLQIASDLESQALAAARDVKAAYQALVVDLLKRAKSASSQHDLWKDAPMVRSNSSAARHGVVRIQGIDSSSLVAGMQQVGGRAAAGTTTPCGRSQVASK